MRILLAEDHDFNQELAVRLLSKHQHEVTVASDGVVAHEMYAADPAAYDLILMDLSMPRMDGFSATRAIRELEAGGEARVPILAMTAHADPAVIRRALEAGMDGHIEKPIDVSAMLAAIEAAARGAALPSASTTPAAPPVDWQAALALVGGDKELMCRLADVFLESEVRMRTGVREAYGRSDPLALEEAAHKLAGAVSNFVAGSAYETAKRLEALALEGDLAAAQGVIAELEKQMDAVRVHLQQALAAEKLSDRP